MYYHPKSYCQVNDYVLGNDNVPFDLFPQGYNVLKTDENEHFYSESFRFFAEECDQLQVSNLHMGKTRQRNERPAVSQKGLQMIAPPSDGFSGLSCALLEQIREDYAKTPITLYSVEHRIPTYHQVGLVRCRRFVWVMLMLVSGNAEASQRKTHPESSAVAGILAFARVSDRPSVGSTKVEQLSAVPGLGDDA